jgi:carboxypeptidase Q
MMTKLATYSWLVLLVVGLHTALAQTSRPIDPTIARIRDEGLNHSHAMETLSYLTDVIGPRLTGSPNLRRANDWTQARFTAWGLANAHQEPWGPFGRGWVLKRFSMQVIDPQAIIVTAYPKAWSPGLEKPIEAGVVYVEGKDEAELAKWHGKLTGMIVLAGAPRTVKAHFEAPGVRMSDEDLLVYANSNGGNVVPARPPEHKPPTAELLVPTTRPARFGPRGQRQASPTTRPIPTPTSQPAGISSSKLLAFLQKENAAMVLSASPQGDGGTIFVAQAAVPGVDFRDRNAPKIWSIKAPPNVPQVAVAVEDYNRMVRMIQQGEKLKMAVDLRVEFQEREELAYNTIAEIRGSDLKEQLVMLGGHMDSWHSGTGATDNGAGVAVAMEAVRILKALDLKPRRTIRVALWTGEEEGLLGSKAYVKEHFGYFPEEAGPTTGPATRSGQRFAQRPTPKLVKGPEYDRLCAYFNLDNGTGKARGVFLQENEALWPVFRRWMVPLNDLGATTISLASTGSTDHISFDTIGLPGFQFIQDPIEYMSRTHHSNQDVYDRVQEEDVKQAAVVMAVFVYEAAMADQMLPRKPLPTTRPFRQRPTTAPSTASNGPL